MDHKERIIYNALEFIAHHDQGAHGVESFRKYAKEAIQSYWEVAEADGSAERYDIGDV